MKRRAAYGSASEHVDVDAAKCGLNPVAFIVAEAPCTPGVGRDALGLLGGAALLALQKLNANSVANGGRMRTGGLSGADNGAVR